jgi:hypothetical protein
VKWRVLGRTITETRSKFTDMPADELEAAIDQAVAAVRQLSAPKAS